MGNIRVLRHFSSGLIVWAVFGLLITGLPAALSSCGGRSASGMDGEQAVKPSGSAFDFAPPSQLKQLSYNPAKLVCSGAEYVAEANYPLQNAAINDTGDGCIFTPDWSADSQSNAGLAYACYSFDMENYNRAQQIAFIWSAAGERSDVWIGLADFRSDCWSWRQLPADDVLSLDLAPYIDSETHTMLVLPVILGTTKWQLSRIHVGDLVTLSGHVWDEDGVTPLADAEVAVIGMLSYSARADWEGRWEIKGVLPGDYDVSAHLLGWEFAPASMAVKVSGLEQAVDDFQGTPLPLHVVSGPVIETLTNEPMRGVEVHVTEQDSPYGGTSVWTEFDGTWTLQLPDGAYRAVPRMPGWTFTPASRDFDVAGADLVVDAFIGVKLPGYTVDGYVYQSDGTTPLESVQINVWNDVVGLYYTVQTDSAGYWMVEDVPDGDYMAQAVMVGWHFVPLDQAVTVAGAACRAADFVGTAVQQYTVDGYIYLDDGVTPLGNINVNLSGSEGWYAATTLSNGHYVFENVYSGEYTEIAADGRYEFTPAERQVNITGDTTLPPILATKLPTVKVDGHIYQPDGVTGIEGVLVTVYRYIPAGTSFEAYTDANGYWVTPQVPSGWYSVLPAKQGYTFEPPDQAIEVTDVDLTVDDFIGSVLPSYTMQGDVSEAVTAAPIAGVQITVLGMNYEYAAVTDASGHWQIDEVFEDSYVVFPMLAPWRFTPPDRSVEVLGADVIVQPFLGEKLEAWIVSGYVLETESEAPIPDIKVWFAGGGMTFWCITDANGYYEIPLPNGDWEASPNDSCWKFDPLSQLFTMAGAAQTLLPFYATPSG